MYRRVPVPAHTNEMGALTAALDQLVTARAASWPMVSSTPALTFDIVRRVSPESRDEANPAAPALLRVALCHV